MAAGAANPRIGLIARRAAATIVAAAALALFGCGERTRAPQTVRLEIPGAPVAQRSWNERPRNFPRVVNARVGDTLLVTNHDKYLRIVAERPIRAGETVGFTLDRPGRFNTTCSGHRDKMVTLVVRPR